VASLLDALAGVWQGRGDGHYPTIAPFEFAEQLTFTPLPGKPIGDYRQRSWREDGTPLHVECGYLRVDADRVELMIAQPTGFVEVHHGRFEHSTVEFGITALGRSATALAVATIRRRWQVTDDRLTTDLWMSYGDVIDGHHLRADFRRAV
jgi:hypothetical protein